MAKQLFILFVIFGINSAMNFPKEQNSQIPGKHCSSNVFMLMTC